MHCPRTPSNGRSRSREGKRPVSVPEHSTYFTWPPHLLCRRTLSTPSTRGKRNLPRPKGCLFVDPLEPRVHLKSGAVAHVWHLSRMKKALSECALKTSATGRGVRGRRNRRLNGDRRRRRDRSLLVVRG